MTTLPELLLARAQRQPEQIAYRFFRGAACASETLTFSALWKQAATLAQLMEAQGLSKECVLLVCKSQQHFVVGFFACLLARVIVVPTAVPRRQSLLDRLRLIARDAKARAIMFDCDEILGTGSAANGDALLELDVRAAMRIEDVSVGSFDWLPRSSDVEDIAFLQYTSGSTCDPKGVMISHANVMSNCLALTAGLRVSEESSILTALPLFHDMGLILGVLQPLYCGCISNFLSPIEFVQYPERWLKIISNAKVTISGGPNFMYDLAASAIHSGEMRNIDLSSWNVAFCGAEPIRSKTISRFIQASEALGFDPKAFYPGYGLAECTLFVSGAASGQSVSRCIRDGVELVGCGVPWQDTHVEIVNPETCERVLEGIIGEIWVSGSSVAQGYWMQSELSTRTFRARIVNDETRDFLRTGDLGFVYEGALYVYARLKDLIIINGQKYAPQDLEAEAERSHIGLRQGGGAAFGLKDTNGERIVVVLEVKRTWLRRDVEWPLIVSMVRSAISSTFGVSVSDVVLIKPGTLPRTSSGKVRRRQCHSDYVAGGLQRLRAMREVPRSKANHADLGFNADSRERRSDTL